MDEIQQFLKQLKKIKYTYLIMIILRWLWSSLEIR